MTERTAPLFPWLEGEPAEPCLRVPAERCFPCIDHDHQAAKSEPELEAGL